MCTEHCHCDGTVQAAASGDDNIIQTLPANEDWSDRLPIDTWGLKVAQAVSMRSRDPSTKVGCVILGPDNTPVSFGYNGFPAGIEDKEEWYQDRPEKYKRIIHAEKNALWHAQNVPAGSTAYVFGHPVCERCVLDLAQAGIARVVQTTKDGVNNFEAEVATELLGDAKIEVVTYDVQLFLG